MCDWKNGEGEKKLRSTPNYSRNFGSVLSRFCSTEQPDKNCGFWVPLIFNQS